MDVSDGQQYKSIEDFAKAVRSAARILWRGDDPNALFNFVDTLNSAVLRSYEIAWREGSSACGILPEDRTPQEQQILNEYMSAAQQRIMPLADFIGQHNRASGSKWADLLPRLNIWVNRYAEIKQRAQVMSCKNIKMAWRLGDAEHCTSCLKLQGKVKRSDFWQAAGILPRIAGASYLRCGGYNCQCSLVPTDEPVSKGPLPNLP